jgi:hypothetical protein
MTERKTITVYKGRNSPVTITVTLLGVPVNFLSIGTNKVGVVIDGVEYSSTDNFIGFADGGKVTFTLGLAPTPPLRKSIGRLVMYTDEFPLGKPILSEKTNFQLLFEFI